MFAVKALGLSVVLTILLPVAGRSVNTDIPKTTTTKSDTGDQTGADYRAKHPDCVAVIEYGKQLRPVGSVTGDPEKDTIAYPVERTQTRCPKREAE